MADWSFYDRGFSLFPLFPRTKLPSGKWKQYMERRATPAELADWQSRPANTGIATGAISDIIVLDCDDLLARLEVERRGIPPTLTVSTPRGTHFYFNHPGWPISNKVGLTWEGWDRLGVDLRGDGGFVVGPGSHFVPTAADAGKGKVEGHYAVERDLPLADMPEWLIELTWPKAHAAPVAPFRMAEETSPFGRTALHGQLADLTNAADGAVSHQIYVSVARIAELVAGGEITTEEGWGGLHEVLSARGLEDEDKAQGTVQRAWAKGTSNPKCAPERMPITPDQALGTRDPVAPPPLGTPAAPPPPTQPDAALVRGQTIWHENMDALFRDCWYVERQEAIFVKGRGLLKKTSFDTVFGGFQFPTKIMASTTHDSAWVAFRTSPSWACPIVYDVCFRPDKAPATVVAIEGRPFINTYEPVVTKRVAGDPSRFLDFLRKLLPIERDYQILTSYMCALVQNPGRKFQWWPVLQGVKGNGKTLTLSALQHAVGKRYSHQIDPEVLGKTANQFNSWIQGNLLVCVEEIFVSDQRHVLETFKPIVTNTRTRVEGKGKDATTGDNFVNGLMATNYKNGVPISDDERRYAILWMAQQEVDDLARDGLTQAYFADLHDWMYGRNAYEALGEDYGFAVVNDWLHTAAPLAEFNPAGVCVRAPATSSTKEAMRESLGNLEQEVLEAIEEQRHGFRGDFVSSHALRSLFQSMRVAIGPKRYRSLMRAVAYIPHPALTDGRVPNPLADGTRPRLYVAKGSPAAALTAAEAPSAFEMAQTIITSGPQGNVIPLRPRA